MTRFIFLLVCVSGPCLLFSQSLHQGAALHEVSVKNAVALYDQRFPQPIALHTGGEYFDYDDRITGFQYFLDEDYTLGWIILDGELFTDVTLKYDIHKDKLIIEHYDEKNYFQELEVIAEKVDSFQVHGYKFFRLRDESVFDNKLSRGFYNILYNGDVNVFSKRYKSYYETLSERTLHREFLLKDRFYVIKKGEAFPVRNRGSVLKVFKDRKKELKKRLKSERLDFKNNFEEAVIVAAKIYDELKADI